MDVIYISAVIPARLLGGGRSPLNRKLLIAQADNSIPTVLLVVVIFWIALIFLSFALFAPRNATVLVTLLVCALSVSGAIYIMLELNSPFDGAIKVSSAPMRDALARLGQ